MQVGVREQHSGPSSVLWRRANVPGVAIVQDCDGTSSARIRQKGRRREFFLFQRPCNSCQVEYTARCLGQPSLKPMPSVLDNQKALRVFGCESAPLNH